MDPTSVLALEPEVRTPPRTAAECFVEERLAAIRGLLGDPEVLEATAATLEALAPDEVHKPGVLAWLREGIARNDRRYEIRSALRALARALRPASYLEIGTRRGWSLAQVAAEVPDVQAWAVDLWIPGYAGVENPGPEFVHGEIGRAVPGFAGRITYIDGNSHDVLPAFLRGADLLPACDEGLALARASESRPHRFDLVTVDGDHTALGAWWDLMDVMPWVALGGAVVFDDLVDTSDEAGGGRPNCRVPRPPPPEGLRPSLLDVWRRLPDRFPGFRYLENLEARPPIGIAVRAR